MLGVLQGVMPKSGLAALGSATPAQGASLLSSEAEAARKRQSQFSLAAARQAGVELQRLRGRSDRAPEDEKAINDLLTTRNALLKQSGEESEDWEAHEARSVPVLERQKLLLSDITGSFKNLGLSKSVEELLGTQAQAAAVCEMLKSPDLDDEVRIRLQSHVRTLDAAAAYRGSNVGRQFARFESDAAIGTSMTNTEISSFGVGRSEGEQLLERRKRIAEELRKLGDVSKLGANDQVRALALVNGMKQTELSLSERLLMNDKDRRQVMVETQREFQKSLVTAGPGELLRKLATFSLSRGGTNAGSFFALSPDARQDVYGLMGGSRMAELNAERRALKSKSNRLGILDTKGLQSMAANADSFSEGIARSLSDKVGVLAQASEAAASNLRSMAVAAVSATNALAGVAIAAQVKNIAPSATPVPQAVGP
jgi:hypothetical protein